MLGRTDDEDVVGLLHAHGYDPVFVAGDDPAAVHEQFAGALDAAHTRIREIQPTPAPTGAAPPAGRRSSCARRRAGPAPRWSTACRSEGRSAPTRCRSRNVRDNPEHLAHARGLDAQLRARRALRREGRRSWPSCGAGARRRAPHGREPARQRRQGPRAARPPRLRGVLGRRAGAGHRQAGVDAPARRAHARHLRAQPRRPSGSSARTRPARTGSARSSRSRTAARWIRSVPTTTTWRPTAA